ncbi:hypothetical protein V8C86DRAFT_3031423, partial [Haematococcus lacustris]
MAERRFGVLSWPAPNAPNAGARLLSARPYPDHSRHRCGQHLQLHPAFTPPLLPLGAAAATTTGSVSAEEAALEALVTECDTLTLGKALSRSKAAAAAPRRRRQTAPQPPSLLPADGPVQAKAAWALVLADAPPPQLADAPPPQLADAPPPQLAAQAAAEVQPTCPQLSDPSLAAANAAFIARLEQAAQVVALPAVALVAEELRRLHCTAEASPRGYLAGLRALLDGGPPAKAAGFGAPAGPGFGAEGGEGGQGEGEGEEEGGEGGAGPEGGEEEPGPKAYRPE